MCVVGGICISAPPPLPPPYHPLPHEPFILLLLDGATWPGKKHSEILRLIWAKRREIIFPISPWDFILMFPTNIGFVFLQSSSQKWQLENKNWVSLPLKSLLQRRNYSYTSPKVDLSAFFSMIYLLLPFTKHMASEVSAANLAVDLSCWLGSQPQLYVSLISK